MSLAVPEQAHEPFQGINHVSSFSRSGVYAVSQLFAKGWIDAEDKVSDPVPMTQRRSVPSNTQIAEYYRDPRRIEF